MNLINLRYEVVKFLGSGNYGLTYLANDRKTKNQVALKISDINSSSRKVVSQLVQQFYTLKSIHNPFIIKPLELEKIFNIDDNPFERDIWFYTMPYVSDSKSIDIYIKENIKKPEKILSLSAKLIYAINFLHRYEISHNDIQNQNILVNKEDKPILLDIFPVRISKYQYYEDFKQLFKLIENSIHEKSKVIPHQLKDFFEYSLENQYDYSLMKRYLQDIIKDENQHLYYFQHDRVVSTSLFKLNEIFEKIRNRFSNNNILLWEDSDSLSSIKDNFHAFLKVKVQNALYLKDKDDLYYYLSFKAGQKISNIKDAEIFLKGSLFHEQLYIIFDDFLNFPNEEKNLLIELSRESKNFCLIRFENFENENNQDWTYHNIFIEQQKILELLSIVFDWDDFDFTKYGFSFSVSTAFKFLVFIKQNIEYFKVLDSKLSLSQANLAKIRKKFFDFISEKYAINSLNEEEKKACMIFLTFQKPVPLNLLYAIDYYKIRKTIYLNLINKKILKYYKNTDSLAIYENVVKQVIEKKIKKEERIFYLNFQNYLYEKWGLTAEDKKNYIKNLKYIKSKKLNIEVLNFYKNFSIFTYYPDYKEVYDLILILSQNNHEELFCYAFKQYLLYSIATLDLSKLKNLHDKVKKLQSCKTLKMNLKEIYEISISLIIAGITYDLDTVNQYSKAAEKYYDNPFVLLVLYYTYSNLLGWIEEGKEVQKKIIRYLDSYDNLEYLFYLYALSAQEKYILQRENKELNSYFILMNIIYNDSKEAKNWIFYLKAAHNIAVYYSSKDDEDAQAKAIQYTKESIYYNEQFKIYPTLLISYSNLVIEYLNKHRNHPEAIKYLKKLEQMSNEAYSKNAIEDEQYLFTLVKLFSFYIQNWELQNARKIISKIEKKELNVSKYPLYFEYLSYKGLLLLRTGQIDGAYNILNLMESMFDNKLFTDYLSLYFAFGLDLFFYLSDYDLLIKLENMIVRMDKSRLESIVIDHDINYLYASIIYDKKINKSLKDQLFGKNYKFKDDQKINQYYKLYTYIENKSDFLQTDNIKKVISKIVSYSRYNGDIFYSFCDNFVSYLVSGEKEYLLEALLDSKIIYSKLTGKEKRLFRSTKIFNKFLKINKAFNFYISHDKGFFGLVEKYSENVMVSYDIMNKIFERFKNTIEEDIENIFNYILKFLVHFGYCTFSAIYKVDETYSIKLVQSFEKEGYKRFSQDYFERCFKIFLTQSSPFIIKAISYDKLKPHIFVAIPILDYSSQITRKESSSVYKFDEYSYFLIFETQRLVNPYWSVTGDFTTFLENLLSFLNNQYLLTQENMYDPLTKVLVRNNFLYKLKNAISKVNKGTLLFIDIDNFKSINDIYSHDFGDKVLSRVASIIKSSVRKPDIVGRYGGEEFLVFIPIISEEAAVTIAERIRINIMNENIIKDQKITVTIGVSNYPKDSIFSDMLISKAEIANRYGKLTGKNRIIQYEDKISTESISKQYINGLIVRDPIKTSENTKILIELLNLATLQHSSFIDRLKNGFELIQKTIQFDNYFITEKNKIVLTNDLNNTDLFLEKLNEFSAFGVSIINNSIFHYVKVTLHDYVFCIGNFKNFPYFQEHNTLFQLYCSTFFLNETIKFDL